MYTKNDIAKLFDHTLLKPNATEDQIRKLCDEAIEYGFHSVCVNPVYVPFVSPYLFDFEIKICTVIDFPLGASDSYAKKEIAVDAIASGSDELDMVLPTGLLLSGYYNKAEEHVDAVVEATVKGVEFVKVIIEVDLIPFHLIPTACKIAENGGADFVKTSTGFFGKGATVEAVKLMKESVSSSVQVKASGGIKTFNDVKNMVRAGASRIGSSSSVNIMKELEEYDNFLIPNSAPRCFGAYGIFDSADYCNNCHVVEDCKNYKGI